MALMCTCTSSLPAMSRKTRPSSGRVSWISYPSRATSGTKTTPSPPTSTSRNTAPPPSGAAASASTSGPRRWARPKCEEEHAHVPLVHVVSRSAARARAAPGAGGAVRLHAPHRAGAPHDVHGPDRERLDREHVSALIWPYGTRSERSCAVRSALRARHVVHRRREGSGAVCPFQSRNVLAVETFSIRT